MSPGWNVNAAGGFEELDHTADLRYRVWAPDLPGLFIWAGRGLFSLCGVRCASSPPSRFSLHVEAGDLESLLVAFLDELNYACETRQTAPENVSIVLNDCAIEAEIEALPLLSREKQIKAVTYHDLKVSREARGWEAEVVFDV